MLAFCMRGRARCGAASRCAGGVACGVWCTGGVCGRPGAGRVAAPWLSVRLLWLEPSWLWRLPTLVASAITPEPVASAVANAVVSAITRVVSSERVRTAAALGVLTKIRAKVRKRGKIQISAIYRL